MDNKDFNNRFILWMGACILFMSFIYLFSITFFSVPEANQRFADTIIGFILGTMIATVIGYFYGSSNGSKQKDKNIEELSIKLNSIDSTENKSTENNNMASNCTDCPIAGCPDCPHMK